MFARVGVPVADSLIAGKSSVILTFGVTNSGKSHTVIGGAGGDAGLIPRLFTHLLASPTARPLSFAALEVYNDRYFDLLASSVPPAGTAPRGSVDDAVLRTPSKVSVSSVLNVLSVGGFERLIVCSCVSV